MPKERIAEGTMATSDQCDGQTLLQSLLEIAIDSWKLARLFDRVCHKLGDEGEKARFVSQHRYYVKRLEETLNAAGVRLVNIEGQPYDPGDAASALNLGDFGDNDQLIVEQMVEPIIMGTKGVLRPGTVMLKKVAP